MALTFSLEDVGFWYGIDFQFEVVGLQFEVVAFQFEDMDFQFDVSSLDQGSEQDPVVKAHLLVLTKPVMTKVPWRMSMYAAPISNDSNTANLGTSEELKLQISRLPRQSHANCTLLLHSHAK
jgi:hypothetical protein